MNISGAAFKLTNEDILSIFNDIVKISGLRIEKVNINKYFYIFGSYKKFIKVPFQIAIFLVKVEQNKLVFQLREVKVLRCPIFKWIRNLILKKALMALKNNGIEYSRGSVSVDLNVLLKNLPIGLSFKFKEIEIGENVLLIETKDIGINMNGITEEEDSTAKAPEKVIEEKKLIKAKESQNESSNDQYSMRRERLKGKIPDKYKVFFPYMMLLPDIFVLFIRLYNDSRVSWKIKVKCGAIIAYLSSPVDIVLDFIPVFGQMDDLAMAFLVLNTIICEVPESIVRENWEGNEDIIVIVRRVLIYLHKFVGETNLSKLIRRINKLFEHDTRSNVFQGEKSNE
ncbi:YkvA family protein [Clostridium oryzae]|uniref:DUF1232 domain-containing protein n=1 Tax=Clostridium oryzae TaxID=1450648 RepID=A0A1V4IG83_9CLOT|nr:DUF1232 domain-containing protein [Clostridium oryzae]OPJ59002.1 hypothetical protein CLORY_34920 [Clostridium oryzae]